MILISDGAECILINRKSFIENAGANSTLNMKFKLAPFPNNETFIIKYFSFLKWEKFRKTYNDKVMKRIHHSHSDETDQIVEKIN